MAEADTLVGSVEDSVGRGLAGIVSGAIVISEEETESVEDVVVLAMDESRDVITLVIDESRDSVEVITSVVTVAVVERKLSSVLDWVDELTV